MTAHAYGLTLKQPGEGQESLSLAVSRGVAQAPKPQTHPALVLSYLAKGATHHLGL